MLRLANNVSDLQMMSTTFINMSPGLRTPRVFSIWVCVSAQGNAKPGWFLLKQVRANFIPGAKFARIIIQRVNGVYLILNLVSHLHIESDHPRRTRHLRNSPGVCERSERRRELEWRR